MGRGQEKEHRGKSQEKTDGGRNETQWNRWGKKPGRRNRRRTHGGKKLIGDRGIR